MLTFNLIFYLLYSLVIFLIGLIGVYSSRKNFILILISLEIMFLSININLALSGLFFNDVSAHIFFIFSLVIAGSEAAIGLALFIVYYKKTQFYTLDSIKGLKA